ncbi:16S rRNA (uracil(1498)-N(3))-methyltransferase [Acetobacter garciniae]|nr:16S rRNA (uracil(1498)-N(3))-methyltransferase [Acetobacter garciniae]
MAPDALPVAQPGATCAMQADHARYLGTVLRRQPGDEVRLFNAVAGEWRASIVHIRKDRGEFRLERPLRAPSPVPGLKLAFALLKRDATDLVLRMGTELGVSEFLPVMTERTNTHRINPQRLCAIATEAAEQCERLDVPHVAQPQSLAALLGGWPQTSRLFTAMERMDMREGGADRTGLHPLRDAQPGDGLLVGPEGGLSEAECQLLLNRPFVVPVSLGPLILRADTAVAAGLALMGDGLRSGIVLSQ